MLTTEETAKPIVLFDSDTNAAGHAPSEIGARAQAAGDYSRSEGYSADRIREQLKLANCIPERLSARRELIEAGSHRLDGCADDQVAAVDALFDELLRDDKVPLCLGGDHLIKAGGLRAALRHYPDLALIYVDAHSDMRMGDGIRYDTIVHCAIAEGLDPKNCVLVGLRQSTDEEALGIQHHRPRILFGSDFAEHSPAVLGQRVAEWLGTCRSVYVSIDPDGLNPIEVGAVEQHYSGGPTVDQLLVVLRYTLAGRELVGIDVSEHVTSLDHHKMTATALAKLVREFTAF